MNMMLARRGTAAGAALVSMNDNCAPAENSSAAASKTSARQ
jgi:hypothetical protein